VTKSRPKYPTTTMTTLITNIKNGFNLGVSDLQAPKRIELRRPFIKASI
jgi:hypothetical protein